MVNEKRLRGVAPTVNCAGATAMVISLSLYLLVLIFRRTKSDVQRPGQADTGLSEPPPYDRPRLFDVFIGELARVAGLVSVGPDERERFLRPLFGISGLPCASFFVHDARVEASGDFLRRAVFHFDQVRIP